MQRPHKLLFIHKTNRNKKKKKKKETKKNKIDSTSLGNLGRLNSRAKFYSAFTKVQ